jgi:group I intron endonuclease
MKNLISKKNYYLSGIYQIRNIINDNIYIGSAYNLYDRFRTHYSNLKLNKHHNQHLQNSYNKYGGDSFVFEVLEILNDVKNIYEIELVYIEKYFGSKCYNISKDTNLNKSLLEYNEYRKKSFILLDPENKEISFSSICDAARIINCSISFVSRLLSGKNKSCKGWRKIDDKDYDYRNYRKVNNKGAKFHDVKLLGPDGLIYGPIFNLEEFSRVHNLNSSVFSNIIHGRTRYCNGWSLYTDDLTRPIEKNAKEYDFTLVSPSGEEFKNIRNLTKFCKDRNLPTSSIRDLCFGKLKKSNYKGWYIKN